tara:strand:+ start:1589 stop:2137 length:549 start_codon:yes stop_codon:yes gene_type:complete
MHDAYMVKITANTSSKKSIDPNYNYEPNHLYITPTARFKTSQFVVMKKGFRAINPLGDEPWRQHIDHDVPLLIQARWFNRDSRRWLYDCSVKASESAGNVYPVWMTNAEINECERWRGKASEKGYKEYEKIRICNIGQDYLDFFAENETQAEEICNRDPTDEDDEWNEDDEWESWMYNPDHI